MTPGYGETPLLDEELEGLLPRIRQSLGEPPAKVDVYELEQFVRGELSEELVPAVASGQLTLQEMLTDSFVRDLPSGHRGSAELLQATKCGERVRTGGDVG
jgi:hypothetical protein